MITLKQVSGQMYTRAWPPASDTAQLEIITLEAVVAVQAQGYDVLIEPGRATQISVVKGCAEIIFSDPILQTSHRQQTGSGCEERQQDQAPQIIPQDRLDSNRNQVVTFFQPWLLTSEVQI
jgi:hypothetical protein